LLQAKPRVTTLALSGRNPVSSPFSTVAIKPHAGSHTRQNVAVSRIGDVREFMRTPPGYCNNPTASDNSAHRTDDTHVPVQIRICTMHEESTRAIKEQ
jgi:hypothetical protein